MKEVSLIFSVHAERRYVELEEGHRKQERMLLDAIKKKEIILKNDQHHGNPIKKRIFPKKYKELYQITNLFRVELPIFWRILYTIITNENKTTIFVLDIVNHKEYDKLFNYRKK